MLAAWGQYLSPVADRVLEGRGHQFMLFVGVVEIIAGVGLLLWPRVFAYVVAVWLLCIIINLLSFPGYYDIALRDVGLLLAALALARLSSDSAILAPAH